MKMHYSSPAPILPLHPALWPYGELTPVPSLYAIDFAMECDPQREERSITNYLIIVPCNLNTSHFIVRHSNFTSSKRLRFIKHVQ